MQEQERKEQEEKQQVSSDDFKTAILIGINQDNNYSLKIIGTQPTLENTLGIKQFFDLKMQEILLTNMKSGPEVALVNELQVIKNNLSMLMSSIQQLHENKDSCCKDK